MVAPQTVTQSLQHCKFVPIRPRHGVITLFGYGIKVFVDRGHLTLHDGIGGDRREARLPRVGHGLRRLVVIGSDGMVSLAALRWLAIKMLRSSCLTGTAQFWRQPARYRLQMSV